jgi:redox-sensitive bicupin YhaK (pirin superfamily)
VPVVWPADGHDHDPFLLLADDRLDLPTTRALGEAHPHAGLETVTFVLEGTLHDRDEGGLSAGDVLWMNAGRGIIHNESVRAGGHIRALQLWIALPSSERDSEPDFELVPATDALVVRGPGYVTRLYSGESNGQRAATRNRTPVTMLDITVEPGATFRHDMPTDHNGFAYVIDGTAHVGGTAADDGDVVWIDPGPGTELHVTGGADGGRVVLYTGRPHRERVLVQGPFAAGSDAELAEYARRYRSGRFASMRALAASRSAGTSRAG